MGRKFGPELAPLYYCIQYTTFFTIYGVDFPVYTEVYLEDFRGMITFEDMEPEKIMKMINKNWDFNKIFGIVQQQLYSNEESSSVKSTNFLVNMRTYIFLILAIISLAFIAFIISGLWQNEIGEEIRD